jgi:hypothetical protein
MRFVRSATAMNSVGGTCDTRPARQRLKPDNAIGAQVDLRLILDGELFVLQRMM